ncbi:MAG: NAD(+) diphosphatase [Gammaproteobacteria bacterium]
MTLPAPNFLSGTPLDRLGHRRTDEAWLSGCRQGGRFLPVWRHRNLVLGAEPLTPAALPWEELAAKVRVDEVILLGEKDGALWFAAGIDTSAEPGLEGEFAEIRAIGHRLSAEDAAVLAYARGMVIWHQRHRYCGRCGCPTVITEAGHARTCSGCEAKHFPRVDPAIIVLVADEDRCLLGRQPSWPPGRYSTIAGFVEPGESLEDAVAREVDEETGVAVTAVEYHSSQPWPFPSSLMLGFIARPTSDNIDLKDGELEDAVWATREDIIAGRVLLPPRDSIAYRLVQQWFDASGEHELEREVRSGTWIPRPES